MSNGIGQGGRQGPAHESQVSGGGAGGTLKYSHTEEVGHQLPSKASLDLSVTVWFLANWALLVASGGLEHSMLCCPFTLPGGDPEGKEFTGPRRRFL